MRFPLLLVSLITAITLKAQTLYWVGGSGNFNEPKNWSHYPGGASANVVPGPNTDVILDKSVINASKINIQGQVNIRSLVIKTRAKIDLVGNAQSRLIIQKEFSDILDNTSFDSHVVLEFKNNSSADHGIIRTGNKLLNTDFVIRGGKWEVNKVMLDHDKSFFVEGGNVDFRNGYVETGNLTAQNTKKLEFNNTVLKVFNEIKFINVNDYTVDKSYLKAKFVNGKIEADDKSGITGKFTSSALVMSPCIINPTIVKPSCLPGCDGMIIITIPSAASPCWPAAPVFPINVIVSNAASCSTVANQSFPAAGTYTINNVCACAIAYNLLVFDQNGFIESEPASVPFPNVDGITLSTGSINCPGLCTGSVSTAFTGGTAPYSFTVFPPAPTASFTASSAGGLNITNLCAGTVTVEAIDSKGCTETYTRTINQPAPFNPGGVTTTVNCFGQCTGIAAVTPTGGTASYTVNWSTGASSVLTAGQTSSLTNLCALPTVLTASVTDSKGCSYPATFTTVITGPTQLTITPTQTNVTCNGLSTGAASVGVSGSFPNYTYTWAPGGQTTNSITGQAAGQYTVTVGHNNDLCQNTQTFTITQPASITINPTVTNVTCPGGSNGSATVSATGGTGAITFTWVAPSSATISTTTSITGQPAGVYTVFATDNNTCVAQIQVTITAPPAFTVTATTQTVLCFGQNNGGATVTVGGGNGPPYNFTWSAAGTASTVSGGTTTASNLVSGTYIVTISDGTCSPGSQTITVTQPTSITLNQTTSSVTCNGGCNGSLTVSPTGGVGPFNYTLVTPAGASVTTAPPFTGLCAGNHTVYVQDQSLCTQSFVINIAQPNPLLPGVTSTSATCFNVCNGSLSGSAGGGVPGYTLAWNTPTGSVAGGILNGVCANTTYTFILTDANGCTATQTASVNQPTAPVTATINPTNPSCNGFCNGALSALVAGGTPGYTLSWSNGFTGNPNVNLCAGNYTLTVTDSKGCTTPITTTLSAPPATTISVVTASPNCSGQANGSATATASGGTPPYTYQFNTTPFPTTNTTGIATGLSAGAYIVNVTDGNGCPQSLNFNINNPPLLTLPLTGTMSSCNACSGGATVNPTGGVPGYTVAWTNSVGATVATGSGASGLCVGNHTATVTDANGCTTTRTVNIVLTVSVNLNLAGSGILCNNVCSGSVVATPAGGTGSYTYTWSPTAQSSSTVSTGINLCPGIQTVQVADGNGCMNTGTINLANPAAIVITTTQVNATCSGSCNGVISATATGGTGTKTFLWSTGATNTGTSSSINGLCAGGYTLTISDANNCSTILNFSITTSASVTATFTTTQPTACGVNNGSICATASGGSGAGYTYSWTPAAGTTTNSCYTGLGAGVYSLVITDGAGCTASLSSLLTNPLGPTLNIATSSVACNGGNTGSATVTATGGAPFGFTWTPVVGFVNIGNVSIGSSLVSGTYAIAVTHSNNCITTQTINIVQAPAYTVATNAVNPSCNGICSGSITLVTSGATPGYTFAWSSATITGVGTQTVTNLCPGGYTVNITDANGCPRTHTFNLTSPPAITLTNVSSNVKCFGACNGSVVATGSGGTGGISYSWTPVGGWTGSVTATVFSLCPNTYTVRATDANGCFTTNVIVITQPTSALTSTLNSLNVSCSNSCNATATITGSGGTPGYNFSWTSSGATTSTVGSLCAGTYSGTVTDANGCTSSQGFTVTAPTPFTATLAPSNPLCNSVCNGSIATTLSGAQGTVAFNWVPTGSGQNPTSLCSGNYTLTAIDQNSCQVLAVTNLVNPPALLANVTSTNPACNALCNGIALSTPANAVGTVSYSWSPTGPPAQTAQTATALCAGNYTVVITDGNGCVDTQTFTLTNPPALNVNISSAAASCGVNNGSITASGSGGTPAYTYSWFPPVSSTSSVVTNLGAGVYTVLVTDFNNCTNTVSVPLSNSGGPTLIPIASTSINCNSQCTGAASINIGSILGGTPSYTVSWVAPPSANTVNPQTNLCTGDYTAQVTDALGCIIFTAVTIAEPSSITIVPNVGLPTCNGVCDGSVSINTSGGTPGYTFNWTPAAPNSSAITNVCAGTLTVQIVDALNCPSTQTVNIPSQNAISVSSVVTANMCFGVCSASVDITSLSFATPPILFSWSNGQTGSTATGLCNGVYTVVVTDAIGCNNTFTSNIISPTQISANVSIASPSCGMCNGTSTALAIGGVAPYTYSWTSGATGSVANNLCAGLYQVLVTDDNNCPQLINVPISNVPGITGENFTLQNELCAGMCNGAATVQAVGGIAPITYTWLTMPATTNSVATNLCAGSYFVQMSDSAGCIRTSSTTIGSAPGLTLSPFITNPACGTSDGSISVVATGGSGGYTYLWTPGGTTNSVITNVGPGNYSVTVTSAGCSTTTAFSISNVNNPTITATPFNVDCFGACSGSVQAIGTTTVPASSVTYLWSTGLAGPTATVITGLCPGVISLTVTDVTSLCSSVQNFTITENPPMQLSLSNVIQPACNGDCNGAVTLIPSGGVLPYTFSWTPAATGNPQFSLCPGGYTATVIDSKNCPISTTFSLVNPAALALTNTVVNSSCSSTADGSISITMTGGTPSYTFNWSGPSSFTSTSQNLSGVLAGSYTLSGVDSRGCSIGDTLDVISTIVVDANAGNDSTFCTNSSIVLSGTNSIGAAGGYIWTALPSTVAIANTSTINVTPATGASTFVLQVISSVSTCVDFDTVVVNSLPLPDVEAGPSFTIPAFSTVQIGGSPTSLSAITYTWLPSLTLDNGSIPNPSASNTVNTTYTVEVTDANGCRASDTMQVLIYPEIIIPNGFSPNNDSKNDRWIIDNIQQFPDCVIEVYNRWGELLFYSKGYNDPFDGRFNGKLLPVGTYYYVINLNHQAYQKPYTGPLTIFR
jgi:gliding motility-associated-like protein